MACEKKRNDELLSVLVFQSVRLLTRDDNNLSFYIPDIELRSNEW